jgi:hypothetical protein
MNYLVLKSLLGQTKYLMRLKIYIFHNPETEEPEKVYEFPWCEATHNEIAMAGRNMFTKEPMKRPIMFIQPVYLTELTDQRHTVTNAELFPSAYLKQDEAKRQQMLMQTEL